MHDRDKTSYDSACSETAHKRPASLVTGPDVQRSDEKTRIMNPEISQTVSPSSEMHVDESEEAVITGIRATDVSLGLRRIPAGFYAAVCQGERQWRTESKPVFVNDDVVEWGASIPIPSDLSATICFEIYGSFEFQPTLGDGEQLRRLTVTVKSLLDCSERELAFVFFPKDGDVISPCSSLSVTIARRQCVETGSSASGALELHCSTMEGISGLEDATNQGHTALLRYQRHGERRDLERSLEQFERALRICPLKHARRAVAQSNNAMAKFVLCQVENSDLSIDICLALYRDALATRPAGHPDRPCTLIKLAMVYMKRFESRQYEVDARQSKELLDEALDLCAAESYEHRVAVCLLHGHEGWRLGLVQGDRESFTQRGSTQELAKEDPWVLGYQLLVRFERFGDVADLERAVSLWKKIVRWTSPWDQRYPGGLSNLGTALLYQFKRLGELSDLEGAISRRGDAVDLTPQAQGHPDKPRRLNNLANSLKTLFECLGELSDLEDAISRHRDAVDLTPQGHPHKPGRLNNLANSLLTRFERLGELSDLEDAISRYRDAVDLTPQDHPDRPACLTNLASSLSTRFSSLGELSNLEDAISRHGDAVDLTPQGHPDKPGRLNNLANSLLTRFSRLGELSDLEDAISRHRDTVDLTAQGHPNKPDCLANLATSLLIRFDCLEELSDIEDAISRYGDAVDLTPPNHPDNPGRLVMLAQSFFARFHRTNRIIDLQQAVSLYSHAACATIGPISVRLDASKKWINCARLLCHHSLLPAYSVAVSLLPQLAWTGLPLTYCYHHLIGASEVLAEAVSTALESGYPEMAVEWLEQGRSIVWGELLQLRDSFEDLSSAHPDYAHQLRNLSTALENAGIAHEQSLSIPHQTQNPRSEESAPESLEQVATRHRRLAMDRDKLLQEIRRLPGFERFALHQEFSQLRVAAHSGPIVFLNATETRCDALIVVANVENVIHVPLLNFTLREHRISLEQLVRRDRGSLGNREGHLVVRNTIDPWNSILSPLWKRVVKPVLDALAFSTIPQDRPRIFWCPTGPFTFLPIHAAGFYDPRFEEPGNKVFDFVVSSYTPTLSILGSSSKLNAESSRDIRLLVVRQPDSDGLSSLPGVAKEIKHIKEVIGSSPGRHVTLTESSAGTVKEVLELMKNADWAHFACHGVQDPNDPTQSGLCLANGRRLSISDITGLSCPRGGLAFLSACETATGEKKLSDEAVHIAAGMLFAGYGGVIGTMWSISDRVAPDVAKDVYEQLFGSGLPPDYRGAAHALDNTMKRLRDRNERSTDWIPFIHVGL